MKLVPFIELQTLVGTCFCGVVKLTCSSIREKNDWQVHTLFCSKFLSPHIPQSLALTELFCFGLSLAPASLPLHLPSLTATSRIQVVQTCSYVHGTWGLSWRPRPVPLEMLPDDCSYVFALGERRHLASTLASFIDVQGFVAGGFSVFFFQGSTFILANAIILSLSPLDSRLKLSIKNLATLASIGSFWLTLWRRWPSFFSKQNFSRCLDWSFHANLIFSAN